MNIFHAKFSTGQVLAAADITNDRLQTWIRRKVIIGQKDDPIEMPGSPGYRRQYSFFNVMEIATGAALTDLGVDPRLAFMAAARFAHTGNAKRLPSLPYAEPVYTLLCVVHDRSTIVRWYPGQDVMASIMHDLNSKAFTLLEMNPLFDRAVTALGYRPEEVLEFGRRHAEMNND